MFCVICFAPFSFGRSAWSVVFSSCTPQRQSSFATHPPPLGWPSSYLLISSLHAYCVTSRVLFHNLFLGDEVMSIQWGYGAVLRWVNTWCNNIYINLNLDKRSIFQVVGMDGTFTRSFPRSFASCRIFRKFADRCKFQKSLNIANLLKRIVVKGQGKPKRLERVNFHPSRK